MVVSVETSNLRVIITLCMVLSCMNYLQAPETDILHKLISHGNSLAVSELGKLKHSRKARRLLSFRTIIVFQDFLQLKRERTIIEVK